MKEILKERYHIIGKLGTGGSGQVFKIWDRVLEKEWALKEFFSDRVGDEKERNLELQVLKKVSHPCFPRIVDIFTQKDKSYFVMDYIEGITLTEYIKQSVFSEDHILKIGIRIGEALLFLHQLTPTLLYLDLKPSNIMIEGNGEIKIVDFGSVIIKGKRARISGTPGYASPEQINLREEGCLLSEQSDIYSLGMVLFSMIQKGEDSLPVIGKKQKRGVLVRRYQPVISPQTEKIIERATKGDWNQRYSSMREMIRDMKKSRESLKKRKKEVLFQGRRKGDLSLWQQEKSILCYDGKGILYFFRILLLCFASLLLLQIPVQAKQEQKFKVIIRDGMGRKVLVKKNSFYKLKENLYFEIPTDNIDAKEFQIQIHYLEEGKMVGEFQLDCMKSE